MGFSTSRAGNRVLLIVALSMFSMTGGCKDGPWQLWGSYSSRFIDAQSGRVFDPNGDRHTTSEGQAYALFFSLADNDRPTFNRILAWTQNNLAGGDLNTHLPAWLWGKDKDGQWKVLDPNSASDADVWMAYSLLEAGRLWNIPGRQRSRPRHADADRQKRSRESSRLRPHALARSCRLPARQKLDPESQLSACLSL